MLNGGWVGITEKKLQMLMLSLPSVFQIPLVTPLCCSCPLSWWQIPVGAFVSPSSVYFLCLFYFCISYIFPMLQTIQSWQAGEMLLGHLQHPPPLVFLLPSSLLQQLLFPFPITPSGSPPAPVAPLFWTTLSSQLFSKSIGWSSKGAWLLKGWVSNKSGVEVV